METSSIQTNARWLRRFAKQAHRIAPNGQRPARGNTLLATAMLYTLGCDHRFARSFDAPRNAGLFTSSEVQRTTMGTGNLKQRRGSSHRILLLLGVGIADIRVPEHHSLARSIGSACSLDVGHGQFAGSASVGICASKASNETSSQTHQRYDAERQRAGLEGHA